MNKFEGFGRWVNDGSKTHLKGNSHQRRIQRRSRHRKSMTPWDKNIKLFLNSY